MKRMLLWMLILTLLAPTALADNAADEMYDRMTELNETLIDAGYFTGDYFAYVNDDYEDGELSFFPEERELQITMVPTDDRETVKCAYVFCFDQDYLQLALNCACALTLYDDDLAGMKELADWLDERALTLATAMDEGEEYSDGFDDAETFHAELFAVPPDDGNYILIAIYFDGSD